MARLLCIRPRYSFLFDRRGPATFDLHVGLVDPPTHANLATESAPTLFEFRDIAHDPARDPGVGKRNTPFGHLDEILKSKLEPEIPAIQGMMISRPRRRSLKRSAMLSIQVRVLKGRICLLGPFAREPKNTMAEPFTSKRRTQSRLMERSGRKHGARGPFARMTRAPRRRVASALT
jgi:hypothetical protein